MTKFQNRSAESVVELKKDGAPVSGVLKPALTVQVRKAGTSSFSFKTLASDDWAELGYGLYALKWSASDMNTLGEFVFRLASSTSDPYLGIFSVVPAPLGILASPGVCIVSGNIVDIGGNASHSQQVSFRASQFPASAGPSLIAGGYLTTTPDAYGNFSVALLQGRSVVVEIAQSGLKHTITVPSQPSASLLDLLPPLP